ncbi:SDR family oxidoreductase [Geomonas propionica]|uniref:SDR family oxidoreductase n=1 Tax=Geomonas propionica TaxID=2798582 RepID=A0ABS0YMT6_9BACT|nr:SDR family oxidoreductase [Geomonas propionica]MBJ6798802.1 SDR family oxidoreductase [Geomonas propionica]
MNPTILITGAGSGFGLGASLELARRGYEVIATTQIVSQITAVKAAAAAAEVTLRVEKLDVCDHADRKRAEQWDVDVLVNNAGIGESGPIAEIPVDLVRASFETNVFGALELTQGLVKGMLKKGAGKIINISSIAGRLTFPYFGPYCMTKHAVEVFSEALRAELEHHNIKVVVIEPGPYDTGFNELLVASKYRWFNDTSLFACDAEVIKMKEANALNNQFHVGPVIAEHREGLISVIVDAVEDPHPEYRYCGPKEWNENVRLMRIEDANNSVGIY